MFLDEKAIDTFLSIIKNTKTNEGCTHTQLFVQNMETWDEERAKGLTQRLRYSLVKDIQHQQSFGVASKLYINHRLVETLPANSRYYCLEYHEKDDQFVVSDQQGKPLKIYRSTIIMKLGVLDNAG